MTKSPPPPPSTLYKYSHFCSPPPPPPLPSLFHLFSMGPPQNWNVALFVAAWVPNGSFGGIFIRKAFSHASEIRITYVTYD